MGSCGCVGGCSCGYVNGAGPDVAQTARARARQQAAAIDEPAPQTRLVPGHNMASADFESLQRFPVRPRLDAIIGAGALGVSTAVAHLPGRQPPAGWDGENDASSPHANTGGPG